MPLSQLYFRIGPDPRLESAPGYWYLRSPTLANGEPVGHLFSAGKWLQCDSDLITAPLVQGYRLDVTFNTNLVPVISPRIADVFRANAAEDVQLLETTIPGVEERYYLVNVLKIIYCVDEARSVEIRKSPPDPSSPEALPSYRGIFGLRVDASKIQGAEVFLVGGWEVATVVSARLRAALLAVEPTGIGFERVG